MTTTTKKQNTATGARPGYKHTPLGWIPEEWETVEMETFAKVTAGGTPNTSIEKYWGGDILWMNSGELNLRYIQNVAGRITIDGLNNSSTKYIPVNSVLIGLAGQGKTRGTVAINKVELCTNQSVAAIMPEPKKVYYHYLFYNLDSRYDELRRLSAGDGGRGGLNLKLLNDLIVILPPLPEQRKIAAILSTWDEAIQTTQALISQLQQRNKGLAQQLLTGKKRLKGFEKEWKTVRVGEVTENFSIRNKHLIDAPVYSVTNTNGFVLQTEHFSKGVAGEDLSGYKIIKKDEFAYNPARVNVGSIARFKRDIGIISSLYVCFSTIDSVLLGEYFSYVLDIDHTKHSIIRYGEGGVRVYLWYPLFAGIKISIPDIKEQQAIAAVLDKADAELKAQEAYLAALQQQKKGLMQQLLTGQVRVKIEKE